MTKKALLIGINYNGTSSKLNGCINDVKNMETLLRDVFQYTEFTILTDETMVKPTRLNMEMAMKNFINSSTEGDELYFHYSGHGYYIPDRNGDETDGKDEVLVPLDYNKAGLISDDWIMSEFVCKVKKGMKLYSCIDCCHSGTSFDLKYNFRPSSSPNQYLFTFERQNAKVDGNVWMFSGCLDPQTAADAYINKTAQGAFTACFIDAIKANLIEREEEKGEGEGEKEKEKIKILKKLRLRDMLREINRRLSTSGFQQKSQLSIAKLTDCDSFFSL